MITIITGGPGAGKTCEMVSILAAISKDNDRPIYSANINGLKLPHTAIDPLKWHDEAPLGAIIAIDEGQEYFRPLGPGQKVPEAIQRMEVHRHSGNDFIITTQGPALLHKNIKDLCTRHIHIRDLGFLGRWWYEWPEANDNPKKEWKTAPLKKRHKLDKKVYDLYKSSSLHVKPVRSFPMMIIVFAVVVLLGLAGTWFGYRNISSRLAPPTPAGLTKATPGAPGVSQSVPVGAAAPASAFPGYLSDYTQFIPRLSGAPETAPAYDELRRVRAMPMVVGGFCRGPKCYCVNQQGRPSGISDGDCRKWLENPPFNPYQDPTQRNPEGVRTVGDKAPPS
jgi:zona occludens toxin